MVSALLCVKRRFAVRLKLQRISKSRKMLLGQGDLPKVCFVDCLIVVCVFNDLFIDKIDCLSVYCSGILQSMSHFLWIVTERCRTRGMGPTRRVAKSLNSRSGISSSGLTYRNTICWTTFPSRSSWYYTPNRYVALIITQSTHLKWKLLMDRCSCTYRDTPSTSNEATCPNASPFPFYSPITAGRRG